MLFEYRYTIMHEVVALRWLETVHNKVGINSDLIYPSLKCGQHGIRGGIKGGNLFEKLTDAVIDSIAKG